MALMALIGLAVPLKRRVRLVKETATEIQTVRGLRFVETTTANNGEITGLARQIVVMVKTILQ